MGEDAYEREATDDEIAAMADVVGLSLQAGALGFSTSTIGLHRGWKGKPVPSNIATRGEIEALMRAVGRGRTRHRPVLPRSQRRLDLRPPARDWLQPDLERPDRLSRLGPLPRLPGPVG